jgi:uncharacterized protein YkwD
MRTQYAYRWRHARMRCDGAQEAWSCAAGGRRRGCASSSLLAAAVLLVAALGGIGCSRHHDDANGRANAVPVALAEPAVSYDARLKPFGVIGGDAAERLSADVKATLVARGDQAEADGSLSAVASWALQESSDNRQVDSKTVEWAVRRFGFSGVYVGFSVFPTEAHWAWQPSLAHGTEVTRYGVRMSPDGRRACVVFGSVDLEHDPIPRAPPVGHMLVVKGQVGPRFSSSQLYLAKPDGSIEEKTISSRRFEATYALSAPGEYRLEIDGGDQTDSFVVANLPLYVGVPELMPASINAVPLTPEQTKSKLLALLNGARKTAGREGVEPDDELDEFALTHAVDMAQNSLVRHNSLTLGTLENRYRRSGIRASLFGENVDLTDTAERAVDSLLARPRERLVLLRSGFTHVGIGVAPGDGEGLFISIDFARRPSPAALPRSGADLALEIAKQRAARSLPIAKLDTIYSLAAQSGADAAANGSSAAGALESAERALRREVERRQSDRPSSCVYQLELLELEQLSTIRMLLQPSLRRFGIGARRHGPENRPALATFFMLEGDTPCEP